MILLHFTTKYPNWKDYLTRNETHSNFDVGRQLEELYSNEIVHRIKVNDYYQQLRDSVISYKEFKYYSDSIFKLQNPIDSINHKKYEQLIDSLGYIPGYDELSLQQVRTHYIILQHYDGAKKAKFVKMFKRGVKKGVLPNTFYTQIEDRYRAKVGKPLLFGNSVKITETGEKVLHGKIRSMKKINKNRVKYGMGII